MANLMAPSAPVSSPLPPPEMAAANAAAEQSVSQQSAEQSPGEAAIQEAAKPVVKQPPQNNRRKFNIKVDGESSDEELDLSNDEEIKKHLQLSKVAQKRMQQFTEYEKNVRSLFEELQKNPIKVLTDPRLGISEETRKHMAEMIINNEIEELQKSPEQKEKEKMQRDYENLKKQHEDEKKARETAEMGRLQQHYATQLDTDISAAIEAEDLPRTGRTVRYMAEALMFCVQNGIDLNAKDLAPLIKKQTLNDFREVISSLPDDKFEDWLGKDQISRIRKRTLQKIKSAAQTANDVKATGTSERNNAPKEAPKKIPMKDFLKSLGSK